MIGPHNLFFMYRLCITITCGLNYNDNLNKPADTKLIKKGGKKILRISDF